MNRVMDQIVQGAITMDDPHIMGVSTIVDAEDEENAEGTSDVDHKSATPYTIHTAVLPIRAALENFPPHNQKNS